MTSRWERRVGGEGLRGGEAQEVIWRWCGRGVFLGTGLDAVVQLSPPLKTHKVGMLRMRIDWRYWDSHRC